MALTDAQREQVYEYLGYPTITFYANPSNTLRQILDGMTANTEARVIVLIGQISTSRTDIVSARGRLKAGKVGDIELNKDEIKQRWREDYRLCQQLGILLGVPILTHPAKGKHCPEVC